MVFDTDSSSTHFHPRGWHLDFIQRSSNVKLPHEVLASRLRPLSSPCLTFPIQVHYLMVMVARNTREIGRKQAQPTWTGLHTVAVSLCLNA